MEKWILRPHSRMRGIALLMTLILLVLLLVIVSQLSYTTKIDGYVARNNRNDLQNHYALISALNYAIAYLKLDALEEENQKDKFDAWTDVWAKEKTLTLRDTKVTYSIEDENAKFNLHHLLLKEFKKPEEKKERQDKTPEAEKKTGPEKKAESQIITPAEQFERLVDFLKEGQDLVKINSKTLRQSIVAWMEEKKAREDLPFYKKRDKLKKRVLFSLKELLFIEEISPMILYGSKGDFFNKFPGISSYVTIWSDGKININTADEKVIASLSTKLGKDLAKRIVERREKGDGSGKRAFINHKEFQDFLISLGAEENSIYPQIKDLITFQSQYFTIHATAECGNLTKKMTAAVLRKKDKVYILFCDWE